MCAYAALLRVRYFKARNRREAADPIDAIRGFVLVVVVILFVVFQGALKVFFNLLVGGALLAY